MAGRLSGCYRGPWYDRAGGTFLPFLYQTRTIQGTSFAKGREGEERTEYSNQKSPDQRSFGNAGDPNPPPPAGAKHRKDNNRQPSQARYGDRSRPLYEGRNLKEERIVVGGEPRASRERFGVSSRPSPDRSRSFDKPLESPRAIERDERAYNVPFEGPMPSSDPLARLEGSTMTPRELMIFENLFKKQNTKKEASQQQAAELEETKTRGYRRHSKRNGADSETPVREFPEVLRPLFEEAQALRVSSTTDDIKDMREKNLVTGAQLPKSSEKHLAVVKSLMDKSKTDVALWQVLHEQAFKKVKALQQDRSASKPSTHTKDFEVLTETLPTILLYFMEHIQHSFPGSPLGLVLLPTLKKLGPSAFAMGTTTQAYNQHMQILYQQYCDLDGIAEILSEMDKEVYDFDAGTRQLVHSIIKHGRNAQAGRFGAGQRALWSMDRKQRGLGKLAQWKQVVDERAAAAAMRKAREIEAEVVGEEDEEDEQILTVA